MSAPQAVPALTTHEANQRDHSAGFLIYQARKSFRDLQAVYGFGGAREIVAEIINSEADRTARYADV